MRRKNRLHKARMARPSLQRTQLPKSVKRVAMLQAVTSIERLDFDEKLELFQQLEIAQGIRKGEKSLKALSVVSQQILHKYETLPTEREKAVYAEGVKNRVYASLQKTIAKG